MNYTQDYLDFLRDQLSVIEGLSHKKMFGGVGFFHNGKMFAGIMYGKFALKVDDSNREDFIRHGMESAMPGKKGKGMPYYEVPAEVVEDQDLLKAWAEKSIAIAHAK